MPRINVALAPAKKALALESYVTSKSYPLAAIFDAIDRLKPEAEKVRAVLGAPDGDMRETLLAVVSGLFVEDETYHDYVVGRNFIDTDPQKAEAQWKTACDALAWTILDKYVKAREGG